MNESKSVRNFDPNDKPTTLEGNYNCFPCDEVKIGENVFCPRPVFGDLVPKSLYPVPSGYGCETANNDLIKLRTDNTRKAFLDKLNYKMNGTEPFKYPNDSSKALLASYGVFKTKFTQSNKMQSI